MNRNTADAVVAGFCTGFALFGHTMGLLLPAGRRDVPRSTHGIWSIYFNTILLATFHERDYIITG